MANYSNWVDSAVAPLVGVDTTSIGTTINSSSEKLH